MRKLATGVGSFIRYWGFRKIHGEIWALVYLAKQALSGVEIAAHLKVSKALVSPAIKELEAEGLIRQSDSENSKTKRYRAEEDVVKIIHGVLERREKVMINQIQQSYEALASQSDSSGAIDLERLQKMGALIQMAQLGLGALLDERVFND